MTLMRGADKSEILGTKGEQILRPKSMEGFIRGPEIPQIHNYTKRQLHNRSNDIREKPSVGIDIKPCDQPNKGRLHIQIRQDLVDRLLDMVFRRKRDPGTDRARASQRAVVEEALEVYFDNEKNPPAD